MANQTIYAVKDIKSGTFDLPFVEPNVINASRGFCLAACNENTKIGAFPHDFELFELGYMDNVNGKLVSLDTPKFIINAQSAIALNRKMDKVDEKVNLVSKLRENVK